MDDRIISIGALSRHELWPHEANTPDPQTGQPRQRAAARTPHATTTLVRSGDAVILVDPGLPGQAVAARLHERSGLRPADVTHVFLTCFRPAHRWGLDAFPDAQWLIAEREREAVGVAMIEQYQAATERGESEDADGSVREALRQDIELLQRCEAAPDKLAPGVDLFPLPGPTAGGCGLLLAYPGHTALIAGDAVPTVEHFEAGRIAMDVQDAEQAKESLQEVIEIADLVVPGHDNVVLNRSRA